MFKLVRLFSCLFVTAEIVHSCEQVRVAWRNSVVVLKDVSSIAESAIEASQQHNSGRARYATTDGYLLYHVQNSTSGVGRWKFVHAAPPAHEVQIAFAESWAIAPHLVDSPVFKTRTPMGRWGLDSDSHVGDLKQISVSCLDSSFSAVYLESSQHQPALTGFYVRQGTSSATPVFRQVTEYTDQHPMFLFPLPSQPTMCEPSPTTSNECMPSEETVTTWLVGEVPFQDAGLAFATVRNVRDITCAAMEDVLAEAANSGSLAWRFVPSLSGENSPPGEPWVHDSAGRLLVGERGADPYAVLEQWRGGGLPRRLPEGKVNCSARCVAGAVF
jgi:hypothetical protein